MVGKSFSTTWGQCTAQNFIIASVKIEKKFMNEITKKIRTRKATIEKLTTFKFIQTKLEQSIIYLGNGKAPYKIFDESCEGLYLFVYPNNNKVFLCGSKEANV